MVVENRIYPREVHADAAWGGHRAALQSRPGDVRRDGDAVIGRGREHRGYLVGRLGPDDGIGEDAGLAALGTPVGGVALAAGVAERESIVRQPGSSRNETSTSTPFHLDRRSPS